jgi:hypothetical protein
MTFWQFYWIVHFILKYVAVSQSSPRRTSNWKWIIERLSPGCLKAASAMESQNKTKHKRDLGGGPCVSEVSEALP